MGSGWTAGGGGSGSGACGSGVVDVVEEKWKQDGEELQRQSVGEVESGGDGGEVSGEKGTAIASIATHRKDGRQKRRRDSSVKGWKE